MKRVLQSQNLIDEIEQAGKRFLISDVKRSDAEWKNLCSRNQQRGPALRSLESLTEEEFPDLAGSKCRKRSVSSDSAIQAVGDCKPAGRNDADESQDGSSVCSSRPVSSLASHSSCSSYAEAAAKGLEHDRSSKTRKGVKQRQRRQRKWKGREIPCASPDSSTVKSSFAESALALNRHSITRRASRRDHVG
jgi:hypothetical protein